MSNKLLKRSSLICLSLVSTTTCYTEEEAQESISTFLPAVREKSVSIVRNLAARVQDLIVQVESLKSKIIEMDQAGLVAQIEMLRSQIFGIQENKKINDLSPMQEALGKLFSEVELLKNQIVLIEEKNDQNNVDHVVGNIVLHLKLAEEHITDMQSRLETVSTADSLNTLKLQVDEIAADLKLLAQKVDEVPTMSSVKQLTVQVNNVQNELQDIKMDVNRSQDDRIILDEATTRGRYGGFVTGEWLFWQFYEGGTDYAVSFDGVSGSLTGARNKDVEFDWRSGFRVGLGYIFEREDWDLYAMYTQINGKGKKDTRGDIFPLLLYQPGPSFMNQVDCAIARWKIEFKNADVDLGREFFISKRLSFHPAFGVKGAWIDQHVNVEYQRTVSSVEQEFSVHVKNDFSGVGPKLGIGTNWFLVSNVSIYGNIAGALLWGEFKLKQVQEQNEVDDIHLKSSLQKLVPTAQIRAGFLFDIFFNRKRNHFGINLGWEMQYWWCQNQMERFTDSNLPIYLRTSDDLSMQGLTLGARFDY
ncbi:MAG: Lpg1974 family pore-forming outer membrane protein [Chlamydiota bacterium]